MLRVAICDDTKEIVEALEQIVKKLIESLHINAEIKKYDKGEDLLWDIEENGVFDIILLDIEMGDLNGIETAKQIREKDYFVQLLFISQHEGYYYQAFEVQPFAFLKKPIDEKELEDKLRKVINRLEYSRESYSFMENKSYSKLFLSEILYFESNGRTVKIHTKSGEVYIHYERLKKIEEKLATGINKFVRIHRSLLVNSEYITRYYYDHVKLIDGESLTISESRRKKIRENYLEFLSDK